MATLDHSLKGFVMTIAEDDPAEAKACTSTLLRLRIERFRGLTELDWHPKPGMNLILGGGDVGKTTILDAISLLLSPVNPANLADTEYHARQIEQGFSIEGIILLPPGCGINVQMKPAWPWGWNGSDAMVPDLDSAPNDAETPVYKIRVRGTDELELYYEIVQPDGTADAFPVALRRAIGLIRLGGDDRNDRDLRLVQGSALDRLLSDKALRSRMASELASSNVKNQLEDQAKDELVKLDAAFRHKNLPSDLDLQITGGQGASIASMVGLTAQRYGVALPLSSWGAGTRRLAALAITEQNQSETPITVVDEIERGLEPYRQRVLIKQLQTAGTQVFLTTHSPTAIGAAGAATLWYVDHQGRIGEIKGEAAVRHRERDPEIFLSRLAVIAEGATEWGFVTTLLSRAIEVGLAPCGVHVTNGGGHENTLQLLEALDKSRLSFAGFVDEENLYPQRWRTLEGTLGKLLFRWSNGCIEQEIIAATPDNKLESLIIDPTGVQTAQRFRSLADRLRIEERDFAAIQTAAGDRLRTLLAEASLGKVPDGRQAEKNVYRAHARAWFKTFNGGRELADKVWSLGLWPDFGPRLLPFCNAVRGAVQLHPLADLP